MSSVLDRAPDLRSGDSTAGCIVDELTTALRAGGITDPRRAASDIVAAMLGVPRSWPFLNSDAPVKAGSCVAIRSAAGRLLQGMPFAYAVGTAQFRTLTLGVDHRVLIPRPETEVLVGLVLERMGEKSGADASWGTAIDVGTGSGAIALSLAAEGRFHGIVGTDVSRDAIEVASSNRARCGSGLACQVEFVQGSLLAPAGGMRATVVVSNPPYIAYSEIESLSADVRDWEPPLALFSGHDGMSATTAIVRSAHAVLEPGGLLALEVDERRASIVADLVMSHGAYTDVAVALDLAGRERFVLAARAPLTGGQ